MNLLITDSTVLIDLERANLVSVVFALPCVLAVPDTLYATELHPFGGQELLDLGLRVETLEGSETSAGLALRRTRPGLSVSAAFGLAFAEARGWTILSEDGLVHAEATSRGIECCGFLWLIDELEKSGCCPLALLVAGLTVLAAGKRCRLPARELTDHIERFRVR